MLKVSFESEKYRGNTQNYSLVNKDILILFIGWFYKVNWELNKLIIQLKLNIQKSPRNIN